MMSVLVVTGGIGSGKSLACRVLEHEYGWPVYNADAQVKHLYFSHPTLLSQIEEALGECFRDERGVFLPAKLASRIFSDRGTLAKVESLVFPCLTQDFMEWKAAHSGTGHLVLESATILEKPQLRDLGDFILLVDAPLSLRCRRAMERDGVSEQEVLKRADFQKLMNSYSNGEIVPEVDFVLLNDSTEDSLRSKLSEIIEKIV